MRLSKWLLKKKCLVKNKQTRKETIQEERKGQKEIQLMNLQTDEFLKVDTSNAKNTKEQKHAFNLKVIF